MENQRQNEVNGLPRIEILNRLLHPRLDSRDDVYEFFRELNEYRYKVVWRSDKESGKERLVICKPKGNWITFPPSVPDRIASVLEISSKEDWEVEKAKAGI